MSGSAFDNSGFGDRIQKIARVAKVAGKSVAGPMVENFVRSRVVDLLSQHDPETLRQYIHVNYPLVEEELPEGVKEALQNAGPQFEEEIKHFVRPEKVMEWMENPQEWLDPEEHPQAVADVRECHDIIKNTPGGEEWIEELCLQFWDEAGLL